MILPFTVALLYPQRAIAWVGYRVPSPGPARGVTEGCARGWERRRIGGAELDIGHAMVRINGESWPTIVVFGSENEEALGAYTLEGFRLADDPFGNA